MVIIVAIVISRENPQMKKIIFTMSFMIASLYSADNLIVLNEEEEGDVVLIQLQGNGETCKLYFSSDGSIDNNSCLSIVNSKGLKIYCTPRKKMCKTYNEIHTFIFSEPQDTLKNNTNSAPRIGSRIKGGIFLYREMIEMYWNDWLAYPMMDKSQLPSAGQVELSVKGEGKTADFSGILSINCQNGKYSWLNSPDDEIPNRVIRNARSLFCLNSDIIP